MIDCVFVIPIDDFTDILSQLVFYPEMQNLSAKFYCTVAGGGLIKDD